MKSETTNTSDRRGATRHAVWRRSVEVGRRRARLRGPRQHPVQQVQDLTPPAARRDDRVDAIAIHERADAVAVRGQDPREHARRTRRRPRASRSAASRRRPTARGRAGTTRRPRAPRCTRGRTASAVAPSRSSRCAGRRRGRRTRAGPRGRARSRETACGSRREGPRRDGGSPSTRGGGAARQALALTGSTRTWVSSGFSGGRTFCMIRVTSWSGVMASASAS